ncbi:hypothetical protein J7M23_12525, partial [Candidatus Sumerlaeota bacterium]|nr:hypothetical protein [Candidatus Sumerlaeota bacterium]
AQHPAATHLIKNIRLAADISLSPEAKNAIDIKKIDYQDDAIRLVASGNIGSGLEKGHFYTHFTAHSNSEGFFRRLQSLFHSPEKVKIRITPETDVELNGTISGKFIPFSIAQYNVAGRIKSVAVDFANKAYVAMPLMVFSIKDNSAIFKKIQLVGAFGRLNLDGSLQLKGVETTTQKPYFDFNFNADGDAEFQINGRVDLNDTQLPFSTNLTVKNLSQRTLAFLLSNTRELALPEIEFTSSTLIAGTLKLSGWLSPFTIGNYSGNLRTHSIIISAPRLNTWSIDKLFIHFTPHLIEAKTLEVHGKPGRIAISGTMRKTPAPANNWMLDFKTSANLNTAELLEFLSKNLTLPPKFSTLLSEVTFDGVIELTLRGKTQLDVSNGIKLNTLEFRSTADFNNLKISPRRYVSPFEISGSISASEKQVIIDKLLTKIERVPTTITGRIYSTPYFWNNPQWELTIAGKTSPSAIFDILHKYNIGKNVLINTDGVLKYTFKARREIASHNKLEDSVSLTADVDDINLRFQKRTLNLKNVKCNLQFADATLTINSVSALVDSAPISVSGDISLQRLNLLISSEIDLARVREELFTILEPIIMDGRASLLLKIAFQNQSASTPLSNASSTRFYGNLLKGYRQLFVALLSRLKNPEFYPGMIDGEVELHNATIYYWELPVPIHNIRGLAFIKGNRIDFENIVADCGRSTNTLNSGSFYLENNIPVLEVRSRLNAFYLNEWVSGWKKPVRKKPLPLLNKIAKPDTDKVKFRLKIEADGKQLIFPPLQGDQFHTVLQYQDFEKGHPNMVEFFETYCFVNGGIVKLGEGKIEINNGIPSYSWKIKADNL